MHIFALIIIPILACVGVVVFRRRAENVYNKVKLFEIKGVGKARFQILLPVGYNFSITESHGFGMIEVNMKCNQAFLSHELGDSRGMMSRSELSDGNVYWEFVDDEFYELQPQDWVYLWLRITKSDGTEFTVDNSVVCIY